MILINGAQGEGGGQIFRTALSLSMCLNRPVTINNIRAGRSKPGLLRQHLTCLRAAQSICGADVTGDQLGSGTVTFVPGPIQAGEYRFAIGSAGSTALVFQTVLPALLMAKGVSELHLEGGTHNGQAPSFDFVEQCFLPLLHRMGYRVEAELERFGFFPAGGGAWRCRIHPAEELSALALMEPGELSSRLAVATSARIPEHVTERELAHVQRQCQWPGTSLHRRLVESCGPGNILSLRLQAENVTEVFEVVGERGVSAERVAERAVRKLRRYVNAGVAVGEYLADQLLLPMALGKGGCFRTLALSRHTQTNIAVIRKFTSRQIDVCEVAKDICDVTVH